MATFNHISGQEPSTVTFKLATVQMTRNSSAMQQEIMSLGDPDSSAAIAAVLNAAPASTAWALATREVLPSTGPFAISSIAGATIIRSSAANALVTAYQSSAADLNVTVAGYVAPSTVVSVSTGSVRVHQSTAADLNVTVAGYVAPSTTVSIAAFPSGMVSSAAAAAGSSALLVRIVGGASSISSIGGIVATAPSDTNWASSAGFHFDSSGALNIAGSFSAQFSSTKADNLVTVYQSSAAELKATISPSDTNWASSAGFHFTSSGELQVNASFSGSTIVTVSTGSVRVIQSTAADLNVTVAGYSTIAAVSSVSGRVGTMPFSTSWASSAGFHFNSSGELQTVGTISISSLSSVAGVVTVTPNSTAPTVYYPVRISDGSTWVVDYVQASTFTSTAVAGGVSFLRAGASSVSSSDLFVMPWGSTQGAQFIIPVTDSGVSVMDSTNRAINVSVVAGSAASTIVTVSTGSVRVHQSSAADLNVTVSGYSTTVQVSSVGGIVTIQGNSTVSIGTNLQSSVAPSSGSSGLVVRQVVDGIATFASTSALASTLSTCVSSAANIRAYVTAYSITSTNQTPAHWGFFSSATLIWPLTLAALSSGVAGANLAVSAPAYLFRTSASEALNFKTAGSTVSGVQLGVSYFLAP